MLMLMLVVVVVVLPLVIRVRTSGRTGGLRKRLIRQLRRDRSMMLLMAHRTLSGSFRRVLSHV